MRCSISNLRKSLWNHSFSFYFLYYLAMLTPHEVLLRVALVCSLEARIPRELMLCLLFALTLHDWPGFAVKLFLYFST